MELLDRNRGRVLALFRIVVSLCFACHGAAALFGILGGVYGGTPSFGAWPDWWAAVIELVGGILVLFGLGTRGAALICSGSMAFAYFTKHQPHEVFPIQNGGEPAVMFCWSYLLIAVFGPGSWALGSLFGRTPGSNSTEVTEESPVFSSS
jgi:putative oxidoreductase